jgi:eukaryotic-like serine/threonine-protein kinase
MQAERWKVIQDLYEAAVALPPEKRAEYLAQACPADDGLRGEVQSLLAQSASSFLEDSPVSAIKTLSPGAKLANFEIVELIGRGGMGEVYRARDSRLKRDVAIKVLPAALARDPDRIARFEREARAAGGLNHPNIVAIYEIGRDDGTYWIATELVGGESLAKVIERGPLSVAKALEIATQIAVGLAAAHAAGIVHRDLKPANIMVARDGRVKILDFGLARRQRTSQDSTTLELTDEGTVMGTAGYMSPEQVRGETVDHRSDLFSFGVILYEMLGGKRAFAGGSSVEVMHAILKEEPGELPASVPPAFDRIVRRCLQKDREQRFQTAADLGWALQSLPLSPAQVAQPKRSARWKWAILAAVALTAGAALWIGARSFRSPAAPENTFRRLTNDSGLTTGAAISPDGKLVAYASDRGDPTNLDIWVQQVDGGGVARVTDDAADDYDPAFSPDATQIAFRSDRKGGGIYVVPALGGEARLVIPEGRRPQFSPDGQWLMYWTGPPEPNNVTGSSEVKFWVRLTGGGESTQIGTGCRLFEQTPVWAPDSSRILFIGICGKDVARVDQPENYGITAWVSTLDGKALKQNRELYGLWRTIHNSPRIDQWIANPSRLLIPLPVGDATSITAVPVSADGTGVGGPPQRLTIAGGSAARVSAARNGRLALAAETSESHIWTLPIDSKDAATAGPQRVTSGPAGEHTPALSADGEKLAFLSIRANGPRLFYKDLATGREKEVSTEGYRYDTPKVSRDGTKILCVQYPSPESWRNVIFEVSIAGGLSRKIWDKDIL